MQSPLTGKEMKLLVRPSTLVIRKEAFPVMYHVWQCEDTGEEFEDQILVERNLRQAADQYRSKHNLPFPEEIQAIREQYGISAAKMSEVLRFGINQYKQYENGELPSESNASLIFLARHPKGFCQLVELSSLEPAEKERLIRKAEEVLEKHADWREQEWMTHLLMGPGRPDVERGFRSADLWRFGSMVKFFAQKMSPYKTQMNKLLFYADFTHFRRHGRSISGAKYRAIEMGPVPNNFDGLFQFAENEHFVRLEHHEYSNGSIGTKFLQDDRALSLEDVELATLQAVFERFQGVKGVKIVEISHEEEAWAKNAATHSIISYLDSYLLKALE
ncbi:MAG TPA: DUF4065 domain-containing protein [Saprospiraceae bacterium]|nr:DUF4065 domain-containing protein [Saprospiraceae bacterium]